jgi:chromate transporter
VAAPTTSPPTFGAALRFWAWLGCVNFGGPAAQIALMRRELVDRRRWIDEDDFGRALGFCTALPGPEAQQLATYCGRVLHGASGGLVAGALFVLPGFCVLVGLSWALAAGGGTRYVEGVAFGLRCAAVALVLEAVPRFARRVFKRRSDALLAAGAFFAAVFAEGSFPIVVAGAALIGAWRAARTAPPPPEAAARSLRSGRSKLGAALKTVGVGGIAWAAPLLGAAAIAPAWFPARDLGAFFSGAALVTFGGAYAVLAYVDQAAVGTFGWLPRGRMTDGLGLAESTPGPLILVVTYVGFMAGWNAAPSDDLRATSAFFGATIATWATFAPSFLLVFLGAPFVDGLRGRPRLLGALDGVAAAVVGVILNLALKLLTHVVFAPRDGGAPSASAPAASGGGSFDVEWTRPNLVAAAVVATCLYLLVRRKTRLGLVLLFALLVGAAAAGFGIGAIR